MSFDSAARDFLRDQGAGSIEHPGGTLYAHLCRVEQRLAGLGAGPDLQLAGLTHAVYGTDGFGRSLLPWSERDSLRSVVGETVETLVYLYGAVRPGSQLAVAGRHRHSARPVHGAA
jgi:hypothetical protein